MENSNKQVYIVRMGEVALKGGNKPYFERMLAERVKRMLKGFEDIEVVRREGLIYLYTNKDHDQEPIKTELKKVFGVASFSPAVEIASDIEAIYEAAVSYMLERIDKNGIETFKIEAKRADKQFAMPSPEISRAVGGKVLIGCKVLKVDVHKPDCKLYVDVRRGNSYLFHEKIQCYGGLPLGTNGRGMILLSGGIDSPVAAFMMAKRGMLIEAIHFHSYPYTNERAQEKVVELAKIVAQYCGKFNLYTVNLLEIQQAIVEHCPEEETTILARRFMMKIAEKLAKQRECQVLITGENIGQVASQTVHGLVVTDHAVSMPVMRPLVAMDKVDIIEIARRIGTFETSILPYEDCCTVFLPKHPVTKPKVDKILASESALDEEALIKSAMATIQVIRIVEE